MKKSFAEAVMSDMDSLMKDEAFSSIFKKAQAVKVAEDQNCAHECDQAHDHDHKCDDKCKDEKKVEASYVKTVVETVQPLSAAAALQQVLTDLAKVSELLDSAGFEKHATLSLNLANSIVVEAKKKKDEKADKKSDKKDEKSKDKPKADKKDEKKSDKKDDKKSDKKDKKDDKKPFPFAKKK